MFDYENNLSDFENEIIQRELERKKAQAEIDAQSRVKVALDSVMASHQGKAVLKLILSTCAPDEPTFTNDPIRTAFNEGRRSVGIRLKEFLGTEYFRAIEDEEI